MELQDKTNYGVEPTNVPSDDYTFEATKDVTESCVHVSHTGIGAISAAVSLP